MDVHAPHTLDEALRLRGEHPGARPIAGGTDLMVALNAERARPDALIDLGRVEELRGWRREGDELVLGAALTYTQAASGELASELPALAAASRTVGSPQIRNRGTIGGNLGTASPAGDALPPLLIEDARSRSRAAGAGARCRWRSSSSAPSATPWRTTSWSSPSASAPRAPRRRS